MQVRIFCIMTLIHLAFMGFGAFSRPTAKKEKLKKIIVHTHTFSPQISPPPKSAPIKEAPPTVKEEKIVEPVKEEQKNIPVPEVKPAQEVKAVPEVKPLQVKPTTTPTPAKKPVPVKAKEPAPTPAVIKKPAAPQTPKKPATTPTQEKALRLLQDSLAKLDQVNQPTKTSSKKNTSQSSSSSSASFSDTSDFKQSYEDSLRAILKEFLELPEWGEVKLQLVLTKEGKVNSVKIVKSASDKNSAYVEKTVSKLIFPPLGKLAIKNDLHEFSLVIRSND